MKALRWLVFLPVAAVLIAIAQVATGLLAEKLPWWIALPIVLFLGVIVAIAGMLPSNIAPDPKIGGGVIAALFVLLEIFALAGSLPGMAWPEIVIRIYTDIAIVGGCIVAATNKPNLSP